MRKTDFDVHFDLAYTCCNQTKFETWFANLAAGVFKAEFELIKAGGHQGDKKSDGRHISSETIYQCYAPESPATFARNARAKIDDSFPEVLTYWPNLKVWIFVHNNDGGITATISDHIEEMREVHKDVQIRQVSRRFLKDDLHDRLSLQQMIDIYPSASLNFSAVQMEHIRPLLRKIIAERKAGYDPSIFGDLPGEKKLDYNNLCPDTRFDIGRARPHVDIVNRYINGMNNPQNATILQNEMRAKYQELKELGYEPDEIMGEMHKFVGGGADAKTNAASYVILAYYFDACDIFENVPEAA